MLHNGDEQQLNFNHFMRILFSCSFCLLNNFLQFSVRRFATFIHQLLHYHFCDPRKKKHIPRVKYPQIRLFQGMYDNARERDN